MAGVLIHSSRRINLGTFIVCTHIARGKNDQMLSHKDWEKIWHSLVIYQRNSHELVFIYLEPTKNDPILPCQQPKYTYTML